jgi:hypothetical protein
MNTRMSSTHINVKKAVQFYSSSIKFELLMFIRSKVDRPTFRAGRFFGVTWYSFGWASDTTSVKVQCLRLISSVKYNFSLAPAFLSVMLVNQWQTDMVYMVYALHVVNGILGKTVRVSFRKPPHGLTSTEHQTSFQPTRTPKFSGMTTRAQKFWCRRRPRYSTR